MAFGFGVDERRVGDIQEYLIEGEAVEQVYGLLVDFVALTNKRVIFVDKTIVSKKTSVTSIPYSKIESISIEKGKTLALSNEIEIVTKHKAYELKFVKGGDVVGFYKSLTKHIC